MALPLLEMLTDALVKGELVTVGGDTVSLEHLRQTAAKHQALADAARVAQAAEPR